MTDYPDNIIGIPIRGEQKVFVANIPWDLTADEALRLAAVIEAYVPDELAASPRRTIQKKSDDYVRGYRDGMRRGRKRHTA